MINIDEFIMIPRSAIQLQEKKDSFTTQDMVDFVEYRDVFLKYIDQCVYKYQTNLGNLYYKVEEIPSIYTKIDWLNELKISIDKTFSNYKNFIKEQEEKKAEKK